MSSKHEQAEPASETEEPSLNQTSNPYSKKTLESPLASAGSVSQNQDFPGMPEKLTRIPAAAKDHKRIYVVRHGQTLFNKKNRIQGWCDSPLTDLGHQQAKATRAYIGKQGFQFDHAFCSTSGRTEQTLKDITDLPYERMDGLKEFHYGELEGESTDLACGAGHNLETYYKQFGGESKSEVEKRIVRTMHDIAKRDDVKNALVVSHGSVSWRFANSVDARKGKKLRKFSNCVIYVYDYDPKTDHFDLVNILDEHVRDLKEKPQDMTAE